MFFLQASQKRFLNNFNAVFVVALTLFVIVGRSVGLQIFPGFFAHLDILLPFVVYFGQRRSMAEGLTLTIITSHLYSLCSSAPIGIFVLLYLMLFLIAQGVSFVFYADRVHSIISLLFVLSLTSRVLALPVVALFGQSWGSFFDAGLIFGPLSNAIVGYVIYRVLALLDQITNKTPTLNIQLAESEL